MIHTSTLRVMRLAVERYMDDSIELFSVDWADVFFHLLTDGMIDLFVLPDAEITEVKICGFTYE